MSLLYYAINFTCTLQTIVSAYTYVHMLHFDTLKGLRKTVYLMIYASF